MRLERTEFLIDHTGKASATRLAGVSLIAAAIILAFIPSTSAVILAEVLTAGLACLGIRTKGDKYAARD